MSEERLDTSSSGRRPDADDFKIITGIGPGVEKRLNNVGIFTFAQLAALSPADIAAAVTGISGLTTERIIKQDWVGQARKLATHSTGSNPDLIKQEDQLTVNMPVTRRKNDANIPGDSRHSTRAMSEQQEEIKALADSLRHVNFTVELLLSMDKEVLSTQVTHLESGNEATWDSWSYAELLSFFIQHARLNPSQQGHSLPGAEEAKPASPMIEGSEGIVALTEEEISFPGLENSEDIVVPMEERGAIPSVAEETLLRATMPSHPVSELRVGELKVIERGTAYHRKTLPSQQPFDVQLTIDLIGQAELTDDSLEYSVHIYAKRLEDRTRHTLAEARGAITLHESITITTQGKTITQGTYRLWANVNLISTGKTVKQSFLSTTHAKQSTLLIY